MQTYSRSKDPGSYVGMLFHSEKDSFELVQFEVVHLTTIRLFFGHVVVIMSGYSSAVTVVFEQFTDIKVFQQLF